MSILMKPVAIVGVTFSTIALMRLASIEHPEELESNSDALNLELSRDGSFLFRPVKNENWTVKASLQRRHLIAIKVNSQGQAQVAGAIENHYAFRELFDFIPDDEGAEGIPELKLENLPEILSQLTQVDVDLNSIVIPPPTGFSFSKLPFTQRELRTTIKTANRPTNPVPIERSWNVSFFDEDVPQGPTTEVLNRAKNVPIAHIEQVKAAFASRPIMSRAYLESKLADSSIISNLKLILPTIAYHWKNGPWHLLWTRYGLDPRSDSQYRQFQSIELRNKMFAKELSRGRVSTKSKQSSITQTTSFCFDGQELTLNYLTYQLCDLTFAPLAQSVSSPGVVKTFVTERDGWFVDGTIKKLRDAMKARWFELIKSADLSALPPQKLEEILQVIAPQTGKLALPGSFKQIISEMKSIEPEIEEEQELQGSEDEQEEESDYEIFD